MERDLHFLERTVERLDRPDVEFAMRLWHEPATVRMLLAELRLPEGEQRVALGMGIGGNGPWLVVTRDGQFVTSLGEGMSPGQCHVVPAQQFATVLARVKRMTAEADAANARVPQDRATTFLRRLDRTGPWLSREDFRVYAAWQPALIGHYTQVFTRQYDTLLAAADVMGRPRQRPVKVVEPALRIHWDAFYSINTLLPLLALEGRQRDMATSLCSREGLTLAATGELVALVRTAWVAGRFGKPVVQGLKQVFRDDPVPNRRFAAAMALLTVALRQRSTRSEVAKILLAGTGSSDASPSDVLSPQTRREWIERMLDDTAGSRAEYLDCGRKFVVQIGQARGGPLRQRWSEVDQVPDDVAGPMLSLSNSSLRTNQTSLVAALLAPAWLAEVEAGDLFLPAEAMALLREPTTFKDTLELFERLHPHQAQGRAPVRVEKVGRNDPCGCGSGAKAKRCCGEAVKPRPVPVEL